MSLVGWFGAQINGTFKIYKLDNSNIRDTDTHLCGSECASKALEAWIAK